MTVPHKGGHSSWLLMWFGPAGSATLGKIESVGERTPDARDQLALYQTAENFLLPILAIPVLAKGVIFTICCALFPPRLLIAAFSTI